MSVVVEGLSIAEDAGDEFAVDDLDLLARAELECIGGEAIEVSQAAVGLLVNQRDRIGVEDLSLAASVPLAQRV